MARTLVIVVGDDYALHQKARTWGTENGVNVTTYSVHQWEEGLENNTFRTSLHLEPVLLNAGTQPTVDHGGGGGKILNFPTPEGSKRVQTMEEMESDAIKKAIGEYRGNLTEAAKALGIGRATLYRKVKQYNIDPSFARVRNKQAA